MARRQKILSNATDYVSFQSARREWRVASERCVDWGVIVTTFVNREEKGTDTHAGVGYSPHTLSTQNVVFGTAGLGHSVLVGW